MTKDKWLLVEDGAGMSRWIPKDKLPLALKVYEEFREMAMRPGSGYTKEEAERMYTLRIVKERD